MRLPRHSVPAPQNAGRRLALRQFGALATAGLFGGCGGGGAGGAPAPQEEIAANLLETTAQNQAATFRNADRLGPSRAFRRSGAVRALPAASITLDDLRFAGSNGETTVSAYMAAQRTAGLLVLKNGRVALERYAQGNTPASRWTSFSVAKSLTSTLLGVALAEGRIGSLDDPVDDYVPALRSGGYAGTPIRSLMRMTSGIRFVESYDLQSGSDLAQFGAAALSGTPGAALEFMRARPRAAAVDSVFNYSSGETYLLGHVLQGATGNNLSAWLTSRLWGPAGMESDGYWLLDPSSGLEFAGGNFSATLRDYGRIGLFLLEGGAGSVRLPAGWASLVGRPDLPVTAYGQLYAGYPLGYGYQWWCFPSGPHAGAFVAQGIFGQFLYVNPAAQVVAVVWSAWRQPNDAGFESDTYALLAAALQALA